jgi:Zn-dependent protease
MAQLRAAWHPLGTVAEDADKGARAGLSFRVAGFPVRVRSSFLVMCALLAFTGGDQTIQSVAIWIAVVFVSVLWHELGHALVARAFGHNAEIELYAMGGVTRHRGAAAGFTWGRSALISLAGPVAGLVLGGAVWMAARHLSLDSEEAQEAVRSALWVNVGWSLVNLLPVLPYDGGNVMRAALGAATGGGGALAAQGVSLAVGGGACALALWAHMPWAAFLAGSAAVGAGREIARMRGEQGIEGAWRALFAGSPAEAQQRAEAILRGRVDDRVRTSAIEVLAWAALQRADVAGARAALALGPPSYLPSAALRATIDLLEGREATAALGEADPQLLAAAWPAMIRRWDAPTAEREVARLVTAASAPALPRELLHVLDTLLFRGGAYRAALAVATRAFEAHGHGDDAYNAACSLARLDRPAEALTWIERALAAGYGDVAHLRADEDLAAVRALPEFARLKLPEPGPPPPTISA